MAYTILASNTNHGLALIIGLIISPVFYVFFCATLGAFRIAKEKHVQSEQVTYFIVACVTAVAFVGLLYYQATEKSSAMVIGEIIGILSIFLWINKDGKE